MYTFYILDNNDYVAWLMAVLIRILKYEALLVKKSLSHLKL